MVQSVRNEYLSALAKENSLTRALDQQKAEAQTMNRKAIDYGVLERDVQSSKQIYESLLQRAKETGVSRELKTSNIRVVDAAERPREPASPRKLLNLTLALLGGSLLAVGLAFFFEYVDSRIKTPEEIRTHLGLSPSGWCPPSRQARGRATDRSSATASRRGLPRRSGRFGRTCCSRRRRKGARTLVITSTAPGEGKTLIAANLAIGLAQAGQRVLLIDADMRCPRLHDMFKQKQEPGLSNLMVGHAAPSACIRKSSVIGLWLLTSGRVPPNPAELLGSQRFKEFIRSLGEHFDSVIIDSPPALAVTDAAVAARLGDRCRVRDRRRDDQPPVREDRAPAAGERASAFPRRRAEPGGVGEQRLLLLGLLQARVRPGTTRRRGSAAGRAAMRRNTAWAFAGNSVYAGCQWVVFVLLVKTLKVEEAGAFAYATAVTGPIFVLANVRLRILLATGIESPGGFSDYLNARLLTTAAAVSMSLGIGAAVSPQVGIVQCAGHHGDGQGV